MNSKAAVLLSLVVREEYEIFFMVERTLLTLRSVVLCILRTQLLVSRVIKEVVSWISEELVVVD